MSQKEIFLRSSFASKREPENGVLYLTNLLPRFSASKRSKSVVFESNCGLFASEHFLEASKNNFVFAASLCECLQSDRRFQLVLSCLLQRINNYQNKRTYQGNDFNDFAQLSDRRKTVGGNLYKRMPNIKVFSGSSHPDLANKVVERLGRFAGANSTRVRISLNLLSFVD